MPQKKIKTVFRTFKILSIVSAALSATLFLLIISILGLIVFIKENVSVEAGGILGFFLDVINAGKNSISSTDLVLSVLPRGIQLLLLFVFSVVSAVALKKGENAQSLAFPGAKRAFASLSALSFLTALLSAVFTKVAQNTVSKDFFNITETSYAGWVVLGLVLLFVSLTVTNEQKEEQ